MGVTLSGKEKGKVKNLANSVGDASGKTILEIQLPTF